MSIYYQDVEDERAEAAEARTAPAVTREDVEKAIHGVYAAHGNWAVTDEMADAVWSLVSGDDPAVQVVRESDVAAVEVERGKDQGWSIPVRGWGWPWHSTAEEIRGYAQENLDRAAACLAVARAIEAGQATDPDPVEAIISTRRPQDYVLVDEGTGSHWRLTADGEWKANVLGQEASDA